jgi:amino acid permease
MHGQSGAVRRTLNCLRALPVDIVVLMEFSGLVTVSHSDEGEFMQIPDNQEWLLR